MPSDRSGSRNRRIGWNAPLVCTVPSRSGEKELEEDPLYKIETVNRHQKYQLASRRDKKESISDVASIHQINSVQQIKPFSPCSCILFVPAAAIKTNCWESTFAPFSIYARIGAIYRSMRCTPITIHGRWKALIASIANVFVLWDLMVLLLSLGEVGVRWPWCF